MRLSSGESGAVAIIVAVLAVLTLFFSAVIVDVGFYYNMRRQLQAAADASSLAGAMELLVNKDPNDPEIQAKVDEYAAKNAVGPVPDLQVIDTEVTATYVKVTVEQQAPRLFFGGFFRDGPPTIQAVAKAQVTPVTDAIGLVPLALPIIEVASNVTVRLPSGDEVPLEDKGNGVWRGNVPFDLAADDNGYELDLIAYNGQTTDPAGGAVQVAGYEYPGVPEEISDFATIVVQESDDPIKDVRLHRNVVTYGSPGQNYLYVETADSAGPSATSGGGGPNIGNFSLVPGEPDLWRASISTPSGADDLIRSYPIDVSVGAGPDKHTIRDATVLIVRRSTYPVEYVAPGGSTFFSPGPNQISVELKLNEYLEGEPYTMKVTGGQAEVGNFMALDFGQIKHPTNWRCNDDSEYTDIEQPAFRTYLGKPFLNPIHGPDDADTICTETGGMAGQLRAGLEERFEGDADRPYAVWVSLNKPDTKRVVYVPVVEKLPKSGANPVAGTYPVRVVRFAGFYVEPSSGGPQDELIGYFIDYKAPGTGHEDPEICTDAGNPTLCTVRLVADGVEF